MDVLFSWLGCFISVEWIFQVHSPISPMLSVWISWMMQPLTRRHLCDPLTRAVGTSFRCTRTVYFLYKNRCVDLFHIVNTLEFKSKWTYLNIWFADFKMDVHVLITKKHLENQYMRLYENSEKWSHLDLPCPNGMVSAMRHGRSCRFQRTWENHIQLTDLGKTSILMYMVKLHWINMGYRHPTSIFIGFPWIPLWVYEPDRGWSHSPRDFGFDWPYHWLHSASPQIGERLHCLETPVESQLIPLANPWKIYRWLSPVTNCCQPHIQHFNPFHDTFS